MAGNKMNTKIKGKEDRNKTGSKIIGQNNEDTEEHDFALLRKPIHTSVTGFGQAMKIFDIATEELKELLSNECDLLYECKVCRNIFRSLANYISHKRVYCKEKFNTLEHSHFGKTNSTISEIMKIKQVEQGYQESLKQINEVRRDENDNDDRIPITKDLTTIIEKIAKNRGSSESNNTETQIVLQNIPNSSVAVYQNVDLNNEKKVDEMGTQVNELNNMLSRNIAVLQSDGKFKIKSSTSTESENVIQISDDDDNDSSILKCKICEMQFSTQKTLKFHMKYKHVESRLVYPCPDCLEIFSTSWSVYRHLFKVHRKTAAQIRRLRESIQAKAFKMNNPPAFYEKRKNNMKASTTTAQKITEEERLEQENQAWMDNMEGDGELPRCGGCGRTFERRAALAAHTHTCQPRSRALARRPQETKKIEIQIRKDYNKGTPINLNLQMKTNDINDNMSKEDSTINKPVKDEQKVESEVQKDLEEDTPMEASEDEKSNDATESQDTEIIRTPIEIPKLNVRLPLAHQTEKSNLVTFRQKIQPDIELNKIMCKRCELTFNDVQELYDHMANHLKWMRYACKLCNFKSYLFSELPEHVKVVHKLKGDKDFYYSTVKAIDGVEALELCEPLDPIPDAGETSPDSRRPSRYSSDSSRISDDSSSSSTRLEGSRKRKSYHNKYVAKRKKEMAMAQADVDMKDDISPEKSPPEILSGNSKSFEENSSDVDDVVENIAKKQIITNDTSISSVASRRPVRRKTKPKNEDFEYDLSNLLKMEAQGYREALVANAKSTQTKKKIQLETQINYDNLNKDCCGALMVMSKKCVEKATAHIKTDFSSFSFLKEVKPQNTFLRPMLPKTFSRVDKASPKKEVNEDRKESSPNKDQKLNKVFVNVPTKTVDQPVVIDQQQNEEIPKVNNVENCNESAKGNAIPEIEISKEAAVVPQNASESTNNVTPPKEPIIAKPTIEIKKPISIPPIKFRRQSLEVMKNPLINKNISDFTKAGMKTKILVIKPINRNKDGTQSVKTSLKFQTIKLKDPNKNSSSEDKSSDQVVVVKVPKVERAIVRPAVVEMSSNCGKTLDKPSVVIPNISDNSIPKTTAAAIDRNIDVVPPIIESITDLKNDASLINSDEKNVEELSKSVVDNTSEDDSRTKFTMDTDNVESKNTAET